MTPEKPCIRRDWVGRVLGDPCPDCRHTSWMHPGSHSPTRAACGVCVRVGETLTENRVDAAEAERDLARNERNEARLQRDEARAAEVAEFQAKSEVIRERDAALVAAESWRAQYLSVAAELAKVLASADDSSSR